MACEIEDGVALDCGGYTVGGINTLYLANVADVILTRETAAGPARNAVIDITLAPGKKFYRFDFQDGSGVATATLQGGGEGQSTSKNFLHTIGWASPAITQQIINIARDLGLARVVAMLESRNPNGAPTPENRHYVLGLGNGLQAASIEGGLGQNRSDLAGPQQRRQKKEKAFREGLKKDDKVVTIGGIHGRIASVEDNYLMLEIDNNVKVKVDKSAIRADISAK